MGQQGLCAAAMENKMETTLRHRGNFWLLVHDDGTAYAFRFYMKHHAKARRLIRTVYDELNLQGSSLY